MKSRIVFVATLALFCCVSSALGQNSKEDKVRIAGDGPVSLNPTAALDSEKSGYVPVLKYDPKRNGAHDIEDALTEATRTNKRVLVEVGGLWCIWCTHMDEFFDKHPDIVAFRDKYYVTVKINYSDDNKNQILLSDYPKIEGYPHIFILENNGKLVHSQDTGELEEGKGYNKEKFFEFLKTWTPAPSQTAGK